MNFLLLICLCSFALPLEGTIASVMTELQHRTEESATDVVIVERAGQIIYQYPSSVDDMKIDSRDMSKALVALAYAFLLEEQKIPYLDVPVRLFFPEEACWHERERACMTLKHLLSGTSGVSLDECLCSANSEVIPPLVSRPGEVYRASGNDSRLLVKLIEKISGHSFDEYLLQKLFIPLGIQSMSWSLAELGEPLHCYLSPADWMKIGQLLLCNGWSNGKQLLHPLTLQRILSPSQAFNPFFGTGWELQFYNVTAWWDESLLHLFKWHGVEPPLVDLLENLMGRQISFTGRMQSNGGLVLENFGHEPELKGMNEDLLSVLHDKGLPLCRFETGKLKSVSALGRGGQELYIYPQGKLVAVRQKKSGPVKIGAEDTFEDFSNILERLSVEYEGWVD